MPQVPRPIPQTQKFGPLTLRPLKVGPRNFGAQTLSSAATEIITHQRPQTLTQFIALVADRLPDPQDALRFKNSFSHAASNHTHSPTPSPQKRLQDKPPQKPQVQPSKGHQASPKASLPQHRPPALSPTCIAKCRQQLSEYYIAPMAQMLIDDVLALHQPTSNHRFVQLVADHLPPVEVENFSRQVLS